MSTFYHYRTSLKVNWTIMNVLMHVTNSLLALLKFLFLWANVWSILYCSLTIKSYAHIGVVLRIGRNFRQSKISKWIQLTINYLSLNTCLCFKYKRIYEAYRSSTKRSLNYTIRLLFRPLDSLLAPKETRHNFK